MNDTVGGRVLEHEAKTIYREGETSGETRGITGAFGILRDLDIPNNEIIARIPDKYNPQAQAEAYDLASA